MVSRRSPPPPPATTPEQAVRDFYTCLIESRYETATSYFPKLQTQYGSAAQAAAELRRNLNSNPFTSIHSIGPAALIADSEQYRVPFEVYTREGSPCQGEFIVQDTHTPQGFVIVRGAV